jgi:hypothetical protein
MTPNSTRCPEGAQPESWHPSNDQAYVPGVTARSLSSQDQALEVAGSTRDRIEDWFKRP